MDRGPPDVGSTIPLEGAALGALKRQYKRRKAALDDARLLERFQRRRRETTGRSRAYAALDALEREIDAALRQRRFDADECSGRRLNSEMKRFRVYVFHSHDGDKAYALRVVGRFLNEEKEDIERGGASECEHADHGKGFGSFVRELRVDIDGEEKTRWRSDAASTSSAAAPDGFEFRGSTETAGGAVEAVIRLTLSGGDTRYRLRAPMAEIVGTTRTTRARLILDLWHYCIANECVVANSGDRVKIDAAMREALVKGGVTPESEEMEFKALCDLVLSNMLDDEEPVELKYKIKTSGASPSKPECYDFDVQVPIASASTQWLDRPGLQKEIDQCETLIDRAATTMRTHLVRRDFLLRFAESPVDFINSCVLNQTKGVYTHEPNAPSNGSLPERVAEHGVDAYKEPWVDEAVMRLI
jgi:SWI/SNF-related matrix-associated actin-dependent regulator of chromatin subfamily D